MKISIVTPVYKATECLDELYARLTSVLNKITTEYEIIMVNDGCPQGSWQKIIEIAQKDSKVKGIDLSRNFGQHTAIGCGIDNSLGEYTVIMDCDLQDDPNEIPKLYQKISEGYDIVQARRNNRQDNIFKRLSGKIYSTFFYCISGKKNDPTICNLCILNKKVTAAIKKLPENRGSLDFILKWLGFNATTIDIQHQKRYSGKSSYTFGKMLKLALVTTINFTDRPLTLLALLGAFITSLSGIIGLYFLLSHVFNHSAVSGWTSLIVSIYFLSGTIITILGILGLYIGKIFNETKRRPLYLIQNKINMNDHD